MITITSDHPELLQAGDVVEYRGRRATVTGVDLEDNDAELGPMFLITFHDDEGGEQLLRSSACRVVEESPARKKLSFDKAWDIR